MVRSSPLAERTWRGIFYEGNGIAIPADETCFFGREEKGLPDDVVCKRVDIRLPRSACDTPLVSYALDRSRHDQTKPNDSVHITCCLSQVGVVDVGEDGISHSPTMC